MASATLVLAGAYSVTAALGSAAGGRMNASATEATSTAARARSQAAYDAAQTELAKLPLTRPVGELEAAYDAAAVRCKGLRCSKPAALAQELGRAKRRAELEREIQRASAALEAAGPGKVANSDAKALARYLAALGVSVEPERLNDLLALLAVLMIESGGGLALALGMTLSGPNRLQSPPVPATTILHAADTTLAKPTTDTRTTPDAASLRPVVRIERTRSASAEHVSDVSAWLMTRGGKSATSMRRLASDLGRSPSGVHDAVRRMVASGMLSATPGPRGTLLELIGAARVN
jgi:hypothetical protein